MSWLWAAFTVLAAGGQVLRNAQQKELTGTLGTVGATHVRFLFGLPFALLFLALVLLISGHRLARQRADLLPEPIHHRTTGVSDRSASRYAAPGQRCDGRGPKYGHHAVHVAMEIIEQCNFHQCGADKFLLQLLRLCSISHLGTCVRMARSPAAVSCAARPDT